MNTENSKTNEPHKFKLTEADKLSLKIPIKIQYWVIQVFIAHGKTLNMHIKTINLKSLLQLEMMNFVFQMDHTIFQTSKIILNTY